MLQVESLVLVDCIVIGLFYPKIPYWISKECNIAATEHNGDPLEND